MTGSPKCAILDTHIFLLKGEICNSMQIHDQCLFNQVKKAAHMTGASNREALYRKVFAYLNQADLTGTNPEIIGQTYQILKQHIQNDDPYSEICRGCNQQTLRLLPELQKLIDAAGDPLHIAVL